MMRTFLVAAPVVAVVALFGIVAAATAQTVSSRDYRIEIYAVNNGDSAVSGSLPVSLFVGNLVAGGYMDDTGDDVLATDASGLVLPGLQLQDLEEDLGTWWVPFRPLAGNGGTGISYLYMGDPGAARDGGIPVESGETITVDDDADFDIADDLTVQVDATLEAIPEAGIWEPLVERSDAFSIEVGDGDKVRASINRTSITSGTESGIRPDATHIPGLVRSSTGSEHWQLVDDPVDDHDGGSTYLQWEGSQAAYVLLSADLSDVLPETGGKVVSIRVYFRCNSITTSSDTRRAYAIVGDGSGGYTRDSGDECDAYSNLENAQFGSSNQKQTYDQIRADGLRFGVEVEGSSTDPKARITQIYARLVYLIVRDRVTLGSITTGPLSVTMTRTAPSLSVQEATSGGSETVTTDGGDIPARSSDITVGGTPGYFRRVRLEDDGTDVLDLQFEPDQVSETQAGDADNDWEWQGTVTDQSTGSHDGTYLITQDMSEVDIEVRPLEILSDDYVPHTSSTPPVRVVDDSFAGAEELIGTREQLPGTPFTEPLDEAANAGLLTPEAWWLVIAAMVGLLVAASVAHATRSPTSPTGILPLAAVAYCAVLGAVFMAGKIDGLDLFLSAIAAGSVVSLHQFSRA